MSEFDLRLEWREEASHPTAREDRFEGELDDEQAELTRIAPDEVGDPQPDRPEEFEYSEHRARALERALGRLQGVTRPPFVEFLARLHGELPRLDAEERLARLDGAEAWLANQLAHWQVGEVESDPDNPEAAQLFNQGLSAGADALGLGLELVSLLRSGEVSLVPALLEQVETFLTQAREALERVPLAPPEA